MRLTKPTKVSEISRNWHLIDVKDQVIGRIAPTIANLLMGKSKPYYARNADCGDYVVVINSRFIRATGNKEEVKKYRKHSGYPGGFKERSLKEMRTKNPNIIVEYAVSGMIPDNKLKKKLMVRLYVYADEKHPYGEKVKK